MEKGIGRITAPLIKALPADRHRVCRRVDLQNHSLAPAAQHFQRPPAIALPPQLGEGAEMLHINKCLGLPAQHQPHPQISVVDEKVLILRYPQNIQLGSIFPLFMERELRLYRARARAYRGFAPSVRRINSLRSLLLAMEHHTTVFSQFQPRSGGRDKNARKGKENAFPPCLFCKSVL